MTTSGATPPKQGTRYEFLLREAAPEGARGAVYDVRVFLPEGVRSAVVELDAGGARLREEPEGLEAAGRTQLLALARTLAKHAEEGGWPRRVLRWRQPGVR